MEGNLLFKINIRRDDLKDSFFFLRYDFGGLIFGGAYFRNFTVPRQIYD